VYSKLSNTFDVPYVPVPALSPDMAELSTGDWLEGVIKIVFLISCAYKRGGSRKKEVSKEVLGCY
jgi:hypothetical protein